MRNRWIKIAIVIFLLTSCSQNRDNNDNESLFPGYDKYGHEIYPSTFEDYELSKFRGKSVYHFLNSINRIDYEQERRIITEGLPGYLTGWYFYYNDSILVKIYVDNFKYINIHTKPQSTISEIEIFENELHEETLLEDFLKEEFSAVRIYKKTIQGYRVISEVKEKEK